MSASFEQMREIFLGAVEEPSPAKREAYLDRACDGDLALRQQVAQLLEAHAAGGSLFDGSSAATDATSPLEPSPEACGTVIGPYKLMEQIGEGGMGVVYVAEQTRPVRRRVALKIIKPGMDTRQVVARFEAERQALAMMDHPNIAKVHDGGATESGRPYFVMELVRGIPITEYCDRERLSIPERLELFVQVCRAVQHAHQKGVIHRDLKPSNILVTVIDGAAVPKVIDFGVAKATGASLTERTLYTAFQQFIGTPLYMSPEQADLSGMDVDTRSDIYSLGVVLYELLTGTTPFAPETFRQAAFDEMRRIIREQEPPKPSTRLSKDEGKRMKDDSKRSGRYRFWPHSSFSLHPSSFQELDWIVMKALEKDRRRRYETAKDFAADVMRHLADQPVEACPPSATYRLRKLARKHRAALITLAGITAVILIAAIVSTLLAIRATTAERLASQRLTESEEARRQSEEARQEAEVVTRRLADMFRRTDPEKDGRQVKVVDLLDQATRDLDADFPGASKVKGELLDTLGGTYKGLGLYDRALELLARALSVRQAALGPDHPDTLRSMYNLAATYLSANHRWAEAMPLFVEALKSCTARLGLDHPDTLRSMFGLANTYIIAGQLEEATSLHEEVLRLRETRLGPDHPDTLHSMFAVALAYRVDGWVFESIPLFEKALELRRARLGPNHLGTLQSMYGLARAYQDADRLDDAIRLSDEALELYKAKLGPDHPTVLRIRAVRAGALGQMRLQQKNYADAERRLREDLSFHEQMMPDNWSRFRSESLLGASLLGQKKYADAEPLLIGAYEGLKRPEGKIRPMLKRCLTEASERVVRLYDEWGKPEKAAEWRAKLARELPAEKNKPKP